MALTMSRPTRSARVKGPMGWPAPSIMAVSVSSMEASPRSTRRMASKRLGTRRRLTMKPGVSLHLTGTLPMALPKARSESKVLSSVAGPRTTSTSFMTGTGLKKWRPANWAGRETAWAISAITSEEVLDARMEVLGAALSMPAKILCFTARFSVAASITRSASFTPSSVLVVTLMRETISSTLALAPASSIFLVSMAFLKPRATAFSMPDTAFFTMSSLTSIMVTLMPAAAVTCTTPLPMRPAPTTATFLIALILLSSVVLWWSP
mmetsp:Transcript_89729/g.239752  ORF Transcript_89729/g.239752 Transcript_89729/m.239752 type:complete len:265 (+) Transcript_89729:235-1029(+)